jgi:hypothetical protein
MFHPHPLAIGVPMRAVALFETILVRTAVTAIKPPRGRGTNAASRALATVNGFATLDVATGAASLSVST